MLPGSNERGKTINRKEHPTMNTRPTKAQLETLKRYWLRLPEEDRMSYRAFRKTAYTFFGDCLMVPWCGMVVGIETDGYGHT